MRTLCIFDVSPFCHAGAVNKYAYIEGPAMDFGAGYVSTDIPAGGASLLFNKIYELMDSCDLVFACDRNPTIKKTMYEGYKANRKHTPEIEKMKEVTERILRDCGFMVLAENGYEADDIIHSLVQNYKAEYDRIRIFTGDTDLCYLVDDTVTIEPSSSRAKFITRENYEVAINSKYRTPYNSCTFAKIINGDPSDCIPGLSKEHKEILVKYVFNDIMLPMLGDKVYMRKYIEACAPWALPQFDLVFPLDVEVPCEINYNVSKNKVCEWGYLIHNTYYRRKVPISESTHSIHQGMIDDGLFTSN